MSTLNLNLNNDSAYTYVENSSWVSPASNDSFRVYAGKGVIGNVTSEDFTARLSFTISEDDVDKINSINKISVKLITASSVTNPGYTRAYLTNTLLSYKDAFRSKLSSSTNGYIAQANSNLASGNQDKNTEVKYEFAINKKLAAGTYYIYIVRKGGGESPTGFTSFYTGESYRGNAIALDYSRNFKIIYNLGDGNSGCPSSETKTEGTNHTLSTSTPTKNDTTEGSTFKITGNANGGSANSVITAKKTSTYKHPFSHWLGSDGKTYARGAIYSTDADITLTAQYTKTHSKDEYENNKIEDLSTPTRATTTDATYTVTLNPDGGNCSVESIKAKDQTEYSFNCWNSKQDGTGTNYTDPSKSFTQETTVYAKWNVVDKKESITLPSPTKNNINTSKEFSIFSDANGGTPDDEITARCVETHKYKFSHWEDNSGKTYNTNYTPTSNITLTAKYTESVINTEYYDNNISRLIKPTRDTSVDTINRITFDPNGGICDIEFLNSKDNSEYTFASWNSVKDGNEDTDYDDSAAFTESKTVYARWNVIDDKESITLPIATRNGYDFVGWHTNKDSDHASLSGGDEYTPNSNLTLYAIWKYKGGVHIGSSRGTILIYRNGEWVEGILI